MFSCRFFSSQHTFYLSAIFFWLIWDLYKCPFKALPPLNKQPYFILSPFHSTVFPSISCFPVWFSSTPHTFTLINIHLTYFGNFTVFLFTFICLPAWVSSLTLSLLLPLSFKLYLGLYNYISKAFLPLTTQPSFFHSFLSLVQYFHQPRVLMYEFFFLALFFSLNSILLVYFGSFIFFPFTS